MRKFAQSLIVIGKWAALGAFGLGLAVQIYGKYQDPPIEYAIRDWVFNVIFGGIIVLLVGLALKKVDKDVESKKTESEQ